MKLLELQIRHFGKFSDKTIKLHDGINVIYGSNEMGKTTIHSFIKGMLFGIKKQRGRASANDEYSLREPWENGGYYAGTLRFESGGKVFRLERNFQKREKEAHLICETDGEELSLEDGDLESLMEGLNEVSFCNTVFIRQKGSQTDGGLALELRNYMTNFQNSGDGEIDVNQALEALDEKRRGLEGEKKKSLAHTTKRKQELQMRMDYISQEMSQLNEEVQEVKRQRLCLEEKKAQMIQEQSGETGKQERPVFLQPRQQFLVLLIGLAALLVCIFVPVVSLKLVSLAAWLLLFGICIWRQYKGRGKDTASSPEEFLKTQETEKLWEAYHRICWKQERVREELKEKETILGNLKEAMDEVSEEAQSNEIEIQAVRLAIETIRSLSEEIHKECAMQLNARISEILSEITGGRYTSVFLDAQMQVRINTPEKLLRLEQVSRGTVDQVYFALRMAAGEMLCMGEKVPVILDDAFAMYDDERLKNTLGWLKKSGRQVILFTCHRREGEMV